MQSRRYSVSESSAPYNLERLPHRFRGRRGKKCTHPRLTLLVALGKINFHSFGACLLLCVASEDNSRPSSPVRKPKRSTVLSMKTAEAIAHDPSHPKRTEVLEVCIHAMCWGWKNRLRCWLACMKLQLLKTYQRGWIEPERFNELLVDLIL